MPRSALGLIETSGLDGAIKAMRAASESGQVVIVSAEQATAGRMTVKIEGEWGAVQSAVEAGARAAFLAGELVSMHVIPKPDQEVSAILPYSRFVDRFAPEDKSRRPEAKPHPAVGSKTTPAAPPRPRPEKTAPVRIAAPAPALPPKAEVPATTVASRRADGILPGEELELMAVVALRRYARTLPELPIKGREISKANKQQLLEVIKSVRKASL